MQVVEMILSLNFTPNVLSHVDLQYFIGGGGHFHPTSGGGGGSFYTMTPYSGQN